VLHIYIYIISSLRVNDLTLILLTWRKWWAPNNASKQQMGFNSAFKGLITGFYSPYVKVQEIIRGWAVAFPCCKKAYLLSPSYSNSKTVPDCVLPYQHEFRASDKKKKGHKYTSCTYNAWTGPCNGTMLNYVGYYVNHYLLFWQFMYPHRWHQASLLIRRSVGHFSNILPPEDASLQN